MKYLSFYLCVILCLASYNISSCYSSKQTQPIGEQICYKEPIVPGWVPVEFGIKNDYILKHRGHLEEIYDEFVGRLFDDGLKLEGTGWLKPTYGNQNLLWTFDSDLGYRHQRLLLKSKEKFQSDTYEFTNDSIEISNNSWKYVGFADKTLGTNSQSFQSFIFVCRGASKGVSVFYWGDGMAMQPQESQSVKELLTELSCQCK